MAFAGFHPIVRQWFMTEVGEPTAAQRRGWESIAAGRHTLIAAPTGPGKTVAAFLTAINALLEESLAQPLPDEVCVLYVSPLKALTAPHGSVVAISATDPLNLTGIVSAGERLRTAGRNRIVYCDGVPIAVVEGDFVRTLAPIDPGVAADVSRALKAPRVPVGVH